MRYTQNFNLKKPERNEYIKIDDINDNADVVDNKLKELEDTKVSSTELTAAIDPITQQLAQTKEEALAIKNSANKGKISSAVVFIGDDARYQERDNLFDIFRSENVPYNMAVIANRLGNPNFLTNEELLRCQNEWGWELLGHSLRHLAAPDDNVTLLNDEEAEAEYRDSKEILEAAGFKINHYVSPGGFYGTRERMYSRKYYQSHRTVEEGINYQPIQTYDLKTYWIDSLAGSSTDFNFFKEKIDEAVANNGLLIISTHGANINPQLQTLFRQVIQYAKTHSRVLTMSQALSEFSNTIEIGDYTQSRTADRVPATDFLALSPEGEFFSNILTKDVIDIYNDYDLDTTYAEYPIGTIHSYIEHTNTPSGTTGLLVNIKKSRRTAGTNYQYFYPQGDAKVYYRVVTGQTTYSSWKQFSFDLTDLDNSYNLTTPYSSIPSGVHYSYIESGVDGKEGMLITLKKSKTKTGNNRQFFLPNDGTSDIYVRAFTSNTTFSDFVKIGNVTNSSIKTELTILNGWDGYVRTVKDQLTTTTLELTLQRNGTKTVGTIIANVPTGHKPRIKVPVHVFIETASETTGLVGFIINVDGSIVIAKPLADYLADKTSTMIQTSCTYLAYT